MCLGIPMQVLVANGNSASCRGRIGTALIDVTMLEPVVAGEWLLTWLGSARSRLDPEDAKRIDRALDALECISRGEPVDVAAFFPDLVDREPELPPHLRGRA
ncbi:MAG TPA: HypC/HybG/HupF family hydrogenase formation chaperone [Steroidobacteraceae bacterium]|nr:HypC/HybG/HupF family hydrogenase formation chaperone [Steroidobacteraceae bacterium]